MNLPWRAAFESRPLARTSLPAGLAAVLLCASACSATTPQPGASASGSGSPSSAPAGSASPGAPTSAAGACGTDGAADSALLTVPAVFGAGVSGGRSASTRIIDPAACGVTPTSAATSIHACPADLPWSGDLTPEAQARMGVTRVATASFERGGSVRVRQVRLTTAGTSGLARTVPAVATACQGAVVARDGDGSTTYRLTRPRPTVIRVAGGHVDVLEAMSGEAPDLLRLMTKVPTG